MPVTYTNRKGVTYTLFRTQGRAGKPFHVFALRSRGEPADELPPGFRISESPNGLVSLLRDRHSLIHADELAAVEQAVQEHPKARRYRVAGKHGRIEVYGQEDPDWVDVYQRMVADGLDRPGLEDRMRENEERYARFTPVLRFILRDKTRRLFGGEQRWSIGYFEGWDPLGQTGTAAELARAVVPVLGGGGLAGGTSGVAGQPASVHRITVTLRESTPPIWRRLLVPSDFSLARLHAIIQIAMGWQECHLHDFRVGEVSYSDPLLLEELFDRDERLARLMDVAPEPNDHFRYLYDFGDNWDHEILVEAVELPEPGRRYPVCVAGERAGPPEDSGGVWGYANLLRAIANRRHPDHRDMMDWLGGPFDAAAFDVEAVNRQFAQSR